MELYTVKKLSSVEEFGKSPLDTLPVMHVLTPEVIVKVDANDNLYIAESSDTSCISNLVKIKKMLCKQEFAKTEENGDVKTTCKLMDDIIWVKPSSCMVYKNGNAFIPMNKVVVNKPVRLQLSCKSSYMYQIGKPYNVYNMFWLIDYIVVDESFDWSTLTTA